MGPYLAKMFFLQADEGSIYTSVWYKNIWTNIVLSNFALVD